MTASDVVASYDRCEATGIHIWIDGGWSVDALVGEETRPHVDLDIAIETRHLPALRKRRRSRQRQMLSFAGRAIQSWRHLAVYDGKGQ